MASSVNQMAKNSHIFHLLFKFESWDRQSEDRTSREHGGVDLHNRKDRRIGRSRWNALEDSRERRLHERRLTPVARGRRSEALACTAIIATVLVVLRAECWEIAGASAGVFAERAGTTYSFFVLRGGRRALRALIAVSGLLGLWILRPHLSSQSAVCRAHVGLRADS